MPIAAQPRARIKGPPPKITEERVLKTAEYLCSGLPLRYALAIDSPVIPIAHWHAVLQAKPVLSAIFEQRVAQLMRDMLAKVSKAECLRKLPPDVWILERRFGEDFGLQKSPSHVTINQTVIGVGQDILSRASELVRRKTPEELAGNAGQFGNAKRFKNKRGLHKHGSSIDVDAQVKPDTQSSSGTSPTQ